MIHIREQDAQQVIELANWAIGFIDEHKPDKDASSTLKANYDALRSGLDDMQKSFAHMMDDQAEMVDCRNCENGQRKGWSSDYGRLSRQATRADRR